MIQRHVPATYVIDDLGHDRQEDDIAALVTEHLGNSPYYALRQAFCECSDGVLILRGQVPSYFLKQIAQTVVRLGSNGSMQIDNQLEVVYPK